MSLEANRAAIVAACEAARAAWTEYDLKVEYDNRHTVDLAAQVDPYLMVDIVYLDSEQMDLNGATPLVGDFGQIMLSAGVKEGMGSAGVVKLLQHFRPYLELKDSLGAVRTRVAKLTRPITVRGFYYQPMLVSFWEIHVAS